MTNGWIAPDRLFNGTDILEDIGLRLSGGRVAAVGPPPPEAHRVPGLVAPGFVDLQVNGGGGVLLNADPTPEGLAGILAAHRRFGTVAVLPTVITDAPEVLERAADAVLAARDLRGLLGLHIEGPHIADARRGTHAAEHIRALDERTMNVVAQLRGAGVTVKITLAPEAATPGQITALAGLGALVSLGHTDATAAEMRAAFAAGATAVTHLFNAMSQMQGRAPGAVGAAIGSDAFVGIICDGRHVAPEMIALACRARPMPDRMMLVSDAMPTVGGPDRFMLYGTEIALRDGRLVNAEGALAGAHVTQAEGLRRLVADVGLSPEAALRMAISTPATCIGRPDLSRLTDRPTEDLILLDETLTYTGPLSAAL